MGGWRDIPSGIEDVGLRGPDKKVAGNGQTVRVRSCIRTAVSFSAVETRAFSHIRPSYKCSMRGG